MCCVRNVVERSPSPVLVRLLEQEVRKDFSSALFVDTPRFFCPLTILLARFFSLNELYIDRASVELLKERREFFFVSTFLFVLDTRFCRPVPNTSLV